MNVVRAVDEEFGMSRVGVARWSCRVMFANVPCRGSNLFVRHLLECLSYHMRPSCVIRVYMIAPGLSLLLYLILLLQ